MQVGDLVKADMLGSHHLGIVTKVFKADSLGYLRATVYWIDSGKTTCGGIKYLEVINGSR